MAAIKLGLDKMPVVDTKKRHIKQIFQEVGLDRQQAYNRGATRSDYASKIWKKVVKDELGITVSLYSFKGMGWEDKRKAGIDTGAVSTQYGHNSVDMTHRYLQGEQDRINKEIMEKTPDF